jgi:hypothetical protein
MQWLGPACLYNYSDILLGCLKVWDGCDVFSSPPNVCNMGFYNLCSESLMWMARPLAPKKWVVGPRCQPPKWWWSPIQSSFSWPLAVHSRVEPITPSLVTSAAYPTITRPAVGKTELFAPRRRRFSTSCS